MNRTGFAGGYFVKVTQQLMHRPAWRTTGPRHRQAVNFPWAPGDVGG